MRLSTAAPVRWWLALFGRWSHESEEHFMDFALNEEQTMIRDMCREFAEEEIKPRAEEMDRTGEFPYDIVRKMADLGLLGLPFPEEYGGAGADFLATASRSKRSAAATPPSASPWRRIPRSARHPSTSSARRSRSSGILCLSPRASSSGPSG